QRGLEEAAQLAQALRAVQVAGIEHQCLERARARPARQLAEAIAAGVQLAAQPLEAAGQRAGEQAAAEQDRPVHRPRTTTGPALQTDRTRQADSTDQAAAEGGVGEFQVAVGHGKDSGRRQNGVHSTGWRAARIDRTDRSAGEAANATSVRAASLQPPFTFSRSPFMAQLRRVAIVGGNRIPFARSNTVYATASNQEMLTAALEGLIERFNLHGERLGE